MGIWGEKTLLKGVITPFATGRVSCCIHRLTNYLIELNFQTHRDQVKVFQTAQWGWCWKMPMLEVVCPITLLHQGRIFDDSPLDPITGSDPLQKEPNLRSLMHRFLKWWFVKSYILSNMGIYLKFRRGILWMMIFLNLDSWTDFTACT